MQPTRSEIDTFKVMSNADFVDWSKAKPREPLVEVDSDDDSRRESLSPRSHDSEDVRPAPAPVAAIAPPRDTDVASVRSGSSRSSRSSRRSAVEEAADIPLPPSRMASVSPVPPPPPPPTAFVPEPVQEPFIPKRVLPQPKKYTAAEENEDYEVRQEKEALLQDILTYERPPHNMKLTRQWNVDQHTLDELQFEYDRIQSELNANQMVDMAKSGIKFGVGGIEMFLKQSGFHAVDGWYKNSCNDMNKYNRPLIKLYKRYWRKTSMSPLMELAFLMFGGLAWTVFENKILRGFGGGGSSAPSTAAPSPAPASRTTEYEPPAAPRAGGMRPPSLGSAVRGPRWTAEPPAASSEPPTPAPSPAAPAPAPAPAPAATDPALLSALNSIAQQNALMMQALQTMQQRPPPPPASPARSRRSSQSRSSSSSRGSAQLRFSMRKTPKSRGTARSRGGGGAAVMAL
jgi:hypothetical protein